MTISTRCCGRRAHPKVHDWLVNYVVKKSPHAEDLRVAWFADPDPVVASAGWALTTDRVAKRTDGLDVSGLLDVIEAQMKDAPDRLQWAMNHCLAQIGIEYPEQRARAIEIGERLEVLKDYPTSPGCTSPFAPIWITEMVRRQPGRVIPGADVPDAADRHHKTSTGSSPKPADSPS